MQDDGGVPLRPRERIISTARDLFRKHGIRGIGVDAIADAKIGRSMKNPTMVMPLRTSGGAIAGWIRCVPRNPHAERIGHASTSQALAG